MQNYPNWIGQTVFENRLPWENALGCDTETFFKKYTVHDATWGAIFQDSRHNDHSIVIIHMDEVWNPSLLTSQVKPNGFAAYLFIRIKGTKNITISNYEDIGGFVRGIHTVKIMCIDSISKMIFTDDYGSEISIEFGGNECEFLILDQAQNIIPIEANF